ncbi:hypothetical protein, partial [Staphylococcus delphini]|uniref:hypothetical protein n=1 Tax=Staphylococcus delphini TaxID=53344 RepID=UPI001F3ED312
GIKDLIALQSITRFYIFPRESHPFLQSCMDRSKERGHSYSINLNNGIKDLIALQSITLFYIFPRESRPSGNLAWTEVRKEGTPIQLT